MTRRSRVWRLHLVRLGQPNPDRPVWHRAVGYKDDWMARHWWIDLFHWRLCLIRRHVQRTTGGA